MLWPKLSQLRSITGPFILAVVATMIGSSRKLADLMAIGSELATTARTKWPVIESELAEFRRQHQHHAKSSVNRQSHCACTSCNAMLEMRDWITG